MSFSVFFRISVLTLIKRFRDVQILWVDLIMAMVVVES